MSELSDFSALFGEVDQRTLVDTIDRTNGFNGANDGQKARQQALNQASEEDLQYLSMEAVTMLDPDDQVSWQRPGIQSGVLRLFRQGKYESQARLDLQGLSLKMAREALREFIDDCSRLGLRTVTVSHGKGLKSQPQALLKSYVSAWLPQFEQVQAIHSAQLRNGGYGALYVMLRKHEQHKILDRERHQKRMGGR